MVCAQKRGCSCIGGQTQCWAYLVHTICVWVLLNIEKFTAVRSTISSKLSLLQAVRDRYSDRARYGVCECPRGCYTVPGSTIRMLWLALARAQQPSFSSGAISRTMNATAGSVVYTGRKLFPRRPSVRARSVYKGGFGQAPPIGDPPSTAPCMIP